MVTQDNAKELYYFYAALDAVCGKKDDKHGDSHQTKAMQLPTKFFWSKFTCRNEKILNKSKLNVCFHIRHLFHACFAS